MPSFCLKPSSGFSLGHAVLLALSLVAYLTSSVHAFPKRLLPRQDNSTDLPCAQIFNNDGCVLIL